MPVDTRLPPPGYQFDVLGGKYTLEDNKDFLIMTFPRGGSRLICSLLHSSPGTQIIHEALAIRPVGDEGLEGMKERVRRWREYLRWRDHSEKRKVMVAMNIHWHAFPYMCHESMLGPDVRRLHFVRRNLTNAVASEQVRQAMARNPYTEPFEIDIDDFGWLVEDRRKALDYMHDEVGCELTLFYEDLIPEQGPLKELTDPDTLEKLSEFLDRKLTVLTCDSYMTRTHRGYTTRDLVRNYDDLPEIIWEPKRRKSTRSQK